MEVKRIGYLRIDWNGFLEHAIESYPNEAAGFLFSRKPYSSEEEWFIFQVKNISDDPENAWIPERKDMLRIKGKAIKMGLTKIGNIHTHPYPKRVGFSEDLLSDIMRPSPAALKFAKRFNDVIRGILVCDDNAIYGIHFHDKFGKKIDVLVAEETKSSGDRSAKLTGGSSPLSPIKPRSRVKQ